jgi:hypothetical protein
VLVDCWGSSTALDESSILSLSGDAECEQFESYRISAEAKRIFLMLSRMHWWHLLKSYLDPDNLNQYTKDGQKDRFAIH